MFTSNKLPSDNSIGPFPISFNYLDGESISVTRYDADGVSNPISLGFSFSGSASADQPSGTTITLASTVPAGYILEIMKDVDLLHPVVNWNSGADVTEYNLRTMSTNLMEMAQKAYDFATQGAVSIGAVIATAAQSANSAAQALLSANSAATSRDTAISNAAITAANATATQTAANSAITSSSNALTYANTATTKANVASASASTASESNLSAQGHAATAVTKASEASSSATAAAASANTAVTNANNALTYANSALANKNSTDTAVLTATAKALEATTAAAQFAVNVKAFGAVGNGVANDTVAIQTAINSISSGTVIFPAGTYKVTQINIKPNVKLIGIGGATLSASANNTSLLAYTNTTGVLQANFYVENLKFSSGGFTGCGGVYIAGASTAVRNSNVHLTGLEFIGTFSFGINLAFCANIFISEVFCILCIKGVYIYVCTDVDINNTKVQSGSGFGFHIDGGVAGPFDEGYRLTNCSTNGQATGLVIQGCDWGCVSNCSFTTCSAGCLVVQTTAQNWKFSNCEFAAGVTPSAGALYAVACYFHQFNNCLFSNNTFGLSIRGDSHTITNCIFNANSNVDLFLNTTTGYSVVNGNVFNSTGNPVSIAHASGGTALMCTNNLHRGTINLTGTNTQVNNQAY
jgi:polygalacturonase